MRKPASRWIVACLVAGVLLVGGGGLPAISEAIGFTTPASAATGEPGHDATDHASHTDPFSGVLLEFAFLLLFAMIGRFLASRFNQASVLGELVLGVIIGNVGYQLGMPFAKLVMHFGAVGQIFNEIWISDKSVIDAAREVLSPDALQNGQGGGIVVELLSGPESARLLLFAAALFMFSQLGVVLLLFMAGIESTITDLLRVGGRAAWVALAGIALPLGLGYVAASMLMREEATTTHLFIGATLCATSVGITTRVLQDLNALHGLEARTILGAAIIDDVLGLVILAVVAGAATTGGVHIGEVSRVLVFSVLFLGVTILWGRHIARYLSRKIGSLDHHEGKLLFPIAFAFVLAWVASQIGLATIVGAFAAGLMLEEGDFENQDYKMHLDKLLLPIEAVFAPVFFVLMGAQVNLETLTDPNVAGLVLALTAVAIFGKLVAGWFAGRGIDRLTVGVGMVPRGEVGLIFASIGKGLGAIPDDVFSAIVSVVILTTFVTPPALRFALGRRAGPSANPT